MKGKRAFIPLQFKSDVPFLRFFAQLLFLSAFEKLVKKNVRRIFLPLNFYVG